MKEFGEISHPKKRKFLASFAETGNVKASAVVAGVVRQTHRNWIQDDPDYKAAFERAKEDAADVLEEEARRRAVSGLKRLKFHNGAPVIDPATGQQYYEHEYSDTLLIFLMKGVRPEVYRDSFKLGASSDGKAWTFTLNIGGHSGDE